MIGTGVLKGMAVTAKNFVGSYFDKERLITVQYPEERSPLPENYRNFPFLVYDVDDAHAGLRCVACQICVEVCPFEAIKMDKVYELSRRERFDALLMDKTELAKSNNYYHQIHPVEAAEVDAALSKAAAEAEAKKKAAAAAAAAKTAAAPPPAVAPTPAT